MIVSPRDGCAQSADCASQPTSAGTHGRELSRVAPGQGQDAGPSICGEYTHLSRYASILTHRHVQTYATRRRAARASAEDRGSLRASRPALGSRFRLTCMLVRPLSILSSRCLCSPDTCRSLQTKAKGRIQGMRSGLTCVLVPVYALTRWSRTTAKASTSEVHTAMCSSFFRTWYVVQTPASCR